MLIFIICALDKLAVCYRLMWYRLFPLHVLYLPWISIWPSWKVCGCVVVLPTVRKNKFCLKKNYLSFISKITQNRLCEISLARKSGAKICGANWLTCKSSGKSVVLLQGQALIQKIKKSKECIQVKSVTDKWLGKIIRRNKHKYLA